MDIVVNLAVLHNRRILLVLKRDVWILPGGKPKSGESHKNCLKREIKEELSVDESNLFIGMYYRSFEGITPHSGKSIESKVYFGDIRQAIYPSNEISGARFFSAEDDLKKYPVSDITTKTMRSLKNDGYL